MTRLVHWKFLKKKYQYNDHMPSWKSAFHLFGSINSIKTLETDYTFSLVFKSIYFFIGNLVYLLVKDAWLIIGRAFNLSHNCTVQRRIKNNVDFAIFLLNVIHVSHLPNLDLVSIINDKPNYCDLKTRALGATLLTYATLFKTAL